MLGQVIGNYRLVSELGRGGMGVVYVAEHVTLGRPAALKMLLPQFSSDEAIVTRFFNEARAAAQIDHPGIVEIYEFGTHADGRAYIVMALLRGETLQQRIARELAPSPAGCQAGATIVAQVASALAVAHAGGIVHRDLKPDNIFLVPNELVPGGVQAKLLDFGIAKLADERASFKTQTGSLIGTPAYMSPEQCMGRSDLDHRTDLYALGCILFHVLCGRPPFVSEAGAGPMIAAHLRDPAPDPRAFNACVSDALAQIVLQLLEKDPARRIQSAAELRNALMSAGANVSVTAPISAQRASQVAFDPTTYRPPPTTDRYKGPEAYHATTTPTTSSGSAAQIIKPAPKQRRTWGMKLGLGAAAVAAAAIATVVAVSRRDDAQPTAHVAQPPAGSAATVPAPTTSPPPPKTEAHEAETVSSGTPDVESSSKAEAEPPCLPGQSRRDDTHGHCCWPEQAWSNAKSKCVGRPRCPAGMVIARGDTCTAVAAPETTTPTTTSTPKFTLEATRVAPKQRVVFRFAAPVPSSGTRRAWVTIVEAGQPRDAYAGWTFVNDRATTVTLEAPSKPGNYEARVHTDYSEKSTNLRHSVPFVVKAPAEDVGSTAGVTSDVTPRAKQRFKLKSSTLAVRENAVLVFPEPIRALPGERFWVTVVKADAGDSTWGDYDYVADKATTMRLRMPATPGDYEVRLHANYPTKSSNVVHRVRVTVR